MVQCVAVFCNYVALLVFAVNLIFLLMLQENKVPAAFPKPEDWGYIMYTSGTTGDPKVCCSVVQRVAACCSVCSVLKCLEVFCI